MVVPIYIRKLGVEAYGLIGAFSALAAIISLLDFGLSPTLNREVARSLGAGDYQTPRRLLHTLAVLYWTTAAVLALAALFLAPYLAPWFRHEKLTAELVTHCLVLMGLVIAARWPGSVYTSAMIGAERLRTVSILSIAMAVVTNVGGVFVVVVAPRIEYYFGWQVAAATLSVMMVRRAAWKVLGTPEATRFSFATVKSTWRFSAGLSGVAVVAAVLTQVDRIVLSRTLPLGEFGQYAIAVGVASSFYLLVAPLFNVIYPRFSALVAKGEQEQLALLYRSWTRTFASALFPLLMGLAICSREVMTLWTGDPAVAMNVELPLIFLCIGIALHAVMNFPYALQLSHGYVRLPLLISSILFVIAAPLMAALALSFGLLGGAAAVLTLHCIYFTLGTWMTHRLLLPSLGARWAVVDVGVPFAFCLILGTVGRAANAMLEPGNVGGIALAAALVIASWAALQLFAPLLRRPFALVGV